MANAEKLKCLRLAPSNFHRRKVVIGPDFQFATSLQQKQGKKLYPKYYWFAPNIPILCKDCASVLENEYIKKFAESSEPNDAQVAEVNGAGAKKAKKTTAPSKSAKPAVHFSKKPVQSQNGRCNMETETGASTEVVRNISDNRRVVPEISSGREVAISSTRPQFEEAAPVCSALIDNFTRMANRLQAKPLATLAPPPQSVSSLFGRVVPKYLPTQLVEETGINTTDSVIEVLLNEDSQISAPVLMGPPPPKPAVSSRRQHWPIVKSVAKKGGGTAAGSSSQAQKIKRELIALPSEHIRFANRKNRLM